MPAHINRMSILELKLPVALLAEITSQSEREVGSGVSLLTDPLKSRFGDSLLAIILYGSCLRTGQFTEGVVDLYIVVDSYKSAYSERCLRFLNAWLPPNVFYLEVGPVETRIRAKYAVISASDLERGCSRWFHSYIWSRFAQPVRLLHVHDSVTRKQLYDWFARAVLTFLRTTIPTLGTATVDTTAIWNNGLALTYAAELRPERHSRARDITEQNLEDFAKLTSSAAPALSEFIQQMPGDLYQGITALSACKHELRLWRFRRWQGLALSVLRLTKAVFTFRDSVDYAAWKIQRHTGISIEVTPGLRRHPILFGFSVLWQLVKRDGLH